MPLKKLLPTLAGQGRPRQREHPGGLLEPQHTTLMVPLTRNCSFAAPPRFWTRIIARSIQLDGSDSVVWAAAGGVMLSLLLGYFILLHSSLVPRTRDVVPLLVPWLGTRPLD
jgi:hypothetical protein